MTFNNGYFRLYDEKKMCKYALDHQKRNGMAGLRYSPHWALTFYYHGLTEIPVGIRNSLIKMG